MKATYEREIFKLFLGHKIQRMLFLQVRENNKRKILKLNIFYLVEKIVRFYVDCRPQISIVYSRCSQ